MKDFGIGLNYDVSGFQSITNAIFYKITLEKGFGSLVSDNYPGKTIDVSDSICDMSIKTQKDKEAVYLPSERSAVWVYESSGTLFVLAAGLTPEDAQEAMEYGRRKAPEEVIEDENTVGMTFWAHGHNGPVSRRRNIEVPLWNEIDTNYNFSTYDELTPLMDEDFRPTKGGQLILWHGPPGTGKTTALRALSRQWKSWADMHFITDPERFFGNDADYMMNVMVDQSNEERWRVLVLEDCGELLAKDARSMLTNPQALSRFLNAVDGILGQGLKFMVLVTTNEDLGKLHDAVTRPGRCLSQLEFKELDPQKVKEWAKENKIEVPERTASLAELFAIKENFSNKVVAQKTVGFGI